MKQKAPMDNDQRKWLNSHTSFYLGLSVDEIENLEKENAALRAALAEIKTAVHEGDPQAIADAVGHVEGV